MVIYIWKMNLTLQFINNKLLTIPYGIIKSKKLWQQQIGQLSKETKQPTSMHRKNQ